MLPIGLSNKQIILKGLWVGFEATLTSSFIYASLVALFMVSLLPINMDIIEFFGILLTFFLLPFIFAILPNLIAGVLMVWILNKLSGYIPIYTEHAGSVGGLIGFVWSIGIAVLMASFIFGSASSASIMWYLIIVATGTYCGALVGYRFITPLLEKQQKTLVSAGDDSVHLTAGPKASFNKGGQNVKYQPDIATNYFIWGKKWAKSNGDGESHFYRTANFRTNCIYVS